jgi:hypothetical protein
LQAVEEEAGGLVVDLVGQELLHDLHEGNLDGVVIFQQGQLQRGALASRAVGIHLVSALLQLAVEITQPLILESREMALLSADSDVLATSDLRWITNFD